MNETVEMIKSRIKNKRILNVNDDETKINSPRNLKYLKNLISRVLVAVIVLLLSIIFTKYSADNLLMYKKYVLNDTWSFGKINSFYKKYMGGILPFDDYLKDNFQTVFDETLVFKNREAYLDGYSLDVGTGTMIPALKSGLIVFIGEKEGYGETIIVQGIDGVDLWYAGLTKSELRLYDYLEKGSLIGESIKDNIYLVIQRDGKYMSYEEYME